MLQYMNIGNAICVMEHNLYEVFNILYILNDVWLLDQYFVKYLNPKHGERYLNNLTTALTGSNKKYFL